MNTIWIKFVVRKYFYRQSLLFSTWHSILLSEHRKETQSGNLYARRRRILYTRRGGRQTQNNRRLCDQASQTQQNAWIQSRRFLENKQGRVQGVPSKYQEHKTRNRQKIKPPQWLVIVRDFTAVSLLLRFSRPHRSRLWCTLPIAIVTNWHRACQWLHK